MTGDRDDCDNRNEQQLFHPLSPFRILSFQRRHYCIDNRSCQADSAFLVPVFLPVRVFFLERAAFALYTGLLERNGVLFLFVSTTLMEGVVQMNRIRRNISFLVLHKSWINPIYQPLKRYIIIS